MSNKATALGRGIYNVLFRLYYSSICCTTFSYQYSNHSFQSYHVIQVFCSIHYVPNEFLNRLHTFVLSFSIKMGRFCMTYLLGLSIL